MATETRGTFLVTEADPDSAVLQDVETAQVYSLDENPGLSVDTVVEATLTPVPPMEVLWAIETVVSTRTIEIVSDTQPPSDRARNLAAGRETGQLVRRSGDVGELHVLPVPPGEASRVVEEVCSDPATLRRAARLGARRVTVRGADGVVSVRYQPLSG